jgi:hypothetical protein
MQAYKADGAAVWVPDVLVCAGPGDVLVPMRGWPYYVAVKRGERYIGHTGAPFMAHPTGWPTGWQ